MNISKRMDKLAYVPVVYHILTVVSVLAECPINAVQNAQLCTASLGIGPPTGPKPFVEKGKVEMAKRACRENQLDVAVKCLQDIIDVCQGNTEREHFLRMMIDVDNTRRSVQYFCSNLNIYENNADCIASLHGEQIRCAEEVRNNFKTKVKATNNMDVIMTSTCRFFNTAVGCSRKVLQAKCGQDAVNIVVRTLLGFQPPKCKELGMDSGYKFDVGFSDGNAASSIFTPYNIDLLIVLVIGTIFHKAIDW
ncbi:hypothetical protein SNE40_014975 [Patella caerulea]|uniref:Uncharacterized protein n=1 Tax=Patella caerulea TaxID=87958 RepID=A0AAN8JJ10_PATCE